MDLLKNIQYIGLILNEKDKSDLINNFKNFIPKDWKFICHHVTLKIKDFDDLDIESLGKIEKIKITHFGIDQVLGCAAFKVETNIESQNSLKHITFAIGNHGEPKNSNFIKQFKKLKKEIEIETTFGAVLKNRYVSYNKNSLIPIKKNKI